jgi:hypothetical protein
LRRKNNKVKASSDLDDELFFNAQAQPANDRGTSDFINEFNKLNEDFSKRINDIDDVRDKNVDVVDAENEEEEIHYY